MIPDYETHCPTCDAPEPTHTPTCAVIGPTEATVVRLQPGDIVILRTDAVVTEEQAERIKRKWFNDNDVICLAPGQDIEIIRPTQD